ncbi:MAG TPA: DUF4159 domain-containing protein [Bryobacteraceae bacterium]|nr:DUF4159 domain-containing protein [Bryobacteraceae bacterium]
MQAVRGARSRVGTIVGVCLLFAGLGLGQFRERVWARYEHEMQDPVDDPPDVGSKGEFVLGRLRYRSDMDGGRSYSRWGIDANKGDRLFISILRRLTAIQVQPIENIIDIDSDDIFEVPWLFAVSVGDWQLTQSQADRLRKYFDRGGFLMVDDFHNEREWASFMAGMHLIYPGAQAEELEDSDNVFHVLFDMKNRVRVPGANVVHGNGVERGGVEPHWRAIRDARGRIIVAISFNQDVGDGWEFADDPQYPERFSSQAIRLGVNYVVYAMTH